MKKNSKSFVSSGKSCNFALAIQLWVVWSLGYGVMVTLQILVLSFLVRVRVSQQSERVEFSTLFFISISNLNIYLIKR